MKKTKTTLVITFFIFFLILAGCRPISKAQTDVSTTEETQDLNLDDGGLEGDLNELEDLDIDDEELSALEDSLDFDF